MCASRAARPTCWWCPRNRCCPSRATCSSTSCRTARSSKRKIQTGQRSVGTRAGHATACRPANWSSPKARRSCATAPASSGRFRGRAEARGPGGRAADRAMKISEVSVKRPVFAAVISLMLVILGLLAASRLPVRELPDVEAPIVSIDTNYLGASADVVETKITQVIEERVAGPRGHHQDHVAEHRRALEHQHRVRPGPLGRRSRQRRARPRRARRRQPAARGGPARGGQGRLRRRPGHLAGAVQRHDERARAYRLRRARAGGPLQRAARRRPRPHERRTPLCHARLDRPRGTGRAAADGRRRRGLAAPRERAAAGRAARIVAARTHAAHRDRPQHRAGFPRAGDRPRRRRLPGPPRRGRRRPARGGERAHDLAHQRRARHQHGHRADFQGQHAGGRRRRSARSASGCMPDLPAGHPARGQPRPLDLHRVVDERGGRGAR